MSIANLNRVIERELTKIHCDDDQILVELLKIANVLYRNVNYSFTKAQDYETISNLKEEIIELHENIQRLNIELLDCDVRQKRLF